MTESMLKPIMAALQDAAQRHLWGQLQVDFQNGHAVLLRVTETVKLPAEENNREYRNR